MTEKATRKIPFLTEQGRLPVRYLPEGVTEAGVHAAAAADSARDSAASAADSAGSATTAQGHAQSARSASDTATTQASAAQSHADTARGHAAAAAGSADQAAGETTRARQAVADAGAARDAARAEADVARAARAEVEASVITGLSWSGSVDLAQYTGPVLLHATLTGAVTLTPPAGRSGVARTVTLVLRQDGTGGRVLRVTGAQSGYGVAPSLSTAPGAIDLVHLLWTGLDWVTLPAAASLGYGAGGTV